MDIKQLRYFVTAVNAKSYSHAAKMLYITQSTLSKSIGQLEDELGVKLLVYTNKELLVTSIGAELYNMAQSIVSQFDTIESAIKSLENSNSGILYLGLPPIIGTSIFPELIENFAVKYPNIQLVIKQAMAKDIPRMVVNNLLDFGFSLEPIKLNVKQTPILYSHYCVIVNKKNPISIKSTIKYTDLIDQKLVLLDESYTQHNRFMVNCETNGFIPNVIMRLHEWDLALRLAEAGVGITVLPEPILKTQQIKNCRIIPFEDQSFDHNITMLSQQNPIKSKAFKLFELHVKNYLDGKGNLGEDHRHFDREERQPKDR